MTKLHGSQWGAVMMLISAVVREKGVGEVAEAKHAVVSRYLKQAEEECERQGVDPKTIADIKNGTWEVGRNSCKRTSWIPGGSVKLTIFAGITF